MLVENMPIDLKVLSREQFIPFPKCGDRSFWGGLDSQLQKDIVSQGDVFKEFSYPMLPAVRYMDFVRNGNRTRYKEDYDKRRYALGSLVMAECVADNGTYLDDIINGIYCICEESSWVVPAHNNQYVDLERYMLPHNTEYMIDLFAAETGELLASAYYLLKDKLDPISPLICEKIQLEIKKRIIEPYRIHLHYWWMGYVGREPNNWNPWITSNVLLATMIIEDNDDYRIQIVKKALHVLDKFIAIYDEDGGCDEGPGYWTRAAASLFDALEVLCAVTEGQLNYYDNPLIKDMGRYVYKMQICNDAYLNFADCGAKVEQPAELIYRYGKRIGCEALMHHGLATFHYHQCKITDIPWFSAYRHMNCYMNYNEMKAQIADFPYVQECFMKYIQVMTTREAAGKIEGLFLGAKGGHNNESHNHNDIGQFVVYKDGKPMIIDVGVGVYSKKTFSPRRYEIWNMQSGYHNLPVINGVDQKDGEAYYGSVCDYEATEKSMSITYELAKAYPDEACVNTYQRRLVLDRKEKVVRLEDKYHLSQLKEPMAWHLMTQKEPLMTNNGLTIINDGTELHIDMPVDHFVLEIEKVPLDDKNLKSVWGEHIYRTKFIKKDEKLRSDFSLLMY
ncbi:heparinase II/III domain-containing protein [Vallitalea okinawensis]|uniref:heparinase II/III domain-containing protein n=1 Tax=Vallitalea okinawensis TaxID=2078660 RepID=UPI0013008220|nr:heparinase II/III family protein [Vallitalea okinawensis]